MTTTPGTVATPHRRRGLTLRQQRELTGWLMVLPALVMVTLFIFYPLFRGFWVSLNRWDGLSSSMEFVGLRNYQNVLHDTVYWQALWHTLEFAIGVTIAKNVIALVL